MMAELLGAEMPWGGGAGRRKSKGGRRTAAIKAASELDTDEV